MIFFRCHRGQIKQSSLNLYYRNYIDVKFMNILFKFPTMASSHKQLLTFRRFSSVANFGTDYFLLKIKILAKRERALTTKFAIARNGC